MAAKKRRGRPPSTEPSVRTWYSYSEQTIEELQDLLSHYKSEAPPFVEKLTERTVIAALIHRAKQEKDAGELPYSDLFGVPAGVSADGT